MGVTAALAAFALIVTAMVAGGAPAGAATSPPAPVADGSDGPVPTRAAPAALDRLEQRAADSGTVRVIVQLRTPFRPEGRLSAAGRVGQRERITGARRRLVNTVAARGGREVRQFTSTAASVLELTPAGVDALRSSPLAGPVTEDTLDRPTLAQTTPLVGATTAVGSGVDGSGGTVAIIDTGVDKNHPFLQGRVVDEACYSAAASCPGNLMSSTSGGSGVHCTYAPSCTHGTHVAGIAAGSHTASIAFDGVAPGTDVMSVAVFSRFEGSTCAGTGEDPCALSYVSDQIAGLERVYSRRAALDIVAVNMSLGAGANPSACDADPRKPMIDSLRSAGIATIVASGNQGAATGVAAPACVSSAISVGATTKSDSIATSYSNSSPQLSLLAPGSSVVSSVPGGGVGSKTGTSMSAPHAAGAWALLKQQTPAASVSTLLSALRSTGPLLTDPRNNVTTPRIDVAAALRSMGPAVAPFAVSHTEGNSGTQLARVPVTLSAPSVVPVVVTYTTLDYQAQAPTDYLTTTGTVTFQPGQTSKNLDVVVKGDLLDEDDEWALVGLTSAANGHIGGFLGLGIANIVDDDAPPTVVPGIVSVTEGTNGVAQVPVALSAPSGKTVTVQYDTLNGTATAPGDYTTKTGSLTFAPGVTTKTVAVTIANGAAAEPSEWFAVSFHDPTNATIGGFLGLGLVGITDDD